MEILVVRHEQKGCRQNSRGTKYQRLIDKVILKNYRRRFTKLTLAWIYYRKAYDMVHHSWIFGMCKNGWSDPEYNHLDREQYSKLEESVDIKPEVLGTVDIKRRICQGNSLSTILFVIIMIPLSLTPRGNNSWLPTQ